MFSLTQAPTDTKTTNVYSTRDLTLFSILYQTFDVKPMLRPDCMSSRKKLSVISGPSYLSPRSQCYRI